MRKIKTTLLLVLAVVAAMAFAVPAGASAANWTENAETLTEEANFDLYGYVSWELGMLQTFSCEVEGSMTLQPGDDGEMVTQVIPETCSGGGMYAGCTFERAPDSVFWPLQAQSEDIIANGVSWQWFLNRCPDFSFRGNVTLSPDNPNAISALFISGSGTYSTGGGSGPSTVSGAVEFEQSAQGIYGLEG